jgi:DNA processing protein
MDHPKGGAAMTQTLFSSTTTPLTPPRTDEDRSAWLRLLRSRGVGPQTFFRLIDEHGSAAAVLELLPELAAKAGVTRYSAATAADIGAELRAGRKAGARLLCLGEPDYPARLAEIADAPPVLWVCGDVRHLSRPAIAIVGARNASSLGERMARKLAQDLGAAGFATVSGLARGIDAAVHAATLGTGTVAVLAGGVDVAYPTENAALLTRIAQQGVVVSEQPMGLNPQARHFPRRNRIVSGLGTGLVVVEAAARSGSLITARLAAEQGRDVMAVPGHPFDARASGCNLLLRDGATLVRGVDDVIEVLAQPSIRSVDPATTPRTALRPDAGNSRSGKSGPAPKPDALRDHAAAIMARLGPTPLPEDQLIRDLALSATQVAPMLMELELDGRIQRHAGGMVSRT